MPITVIPAAKTGGQAFSEAFQPYLQMAIQAMIKQKLGAPEEERKERELTLKEEALPMKNLIQMGDLVKSLQEIGIDPRVILGTKAFKELSTQPIGAPQPGQPGIPTPTPRSGIPQPTPTAPTVPPSISGQLPQLRGKTFERETRPFSPQFGQIIPKTFERVPSPEELEREAEQSARAAGIKQVVLDKLKGLPGESAGKLTMIKQALSDLEGVEKQLFTPAGEFRRGLAFSANIPAGRAPFIGRLIPDVGFGTEARILNSRMNNALEAKLRIETGAAATQEEFDRLQTRFGITGFDTAKSARNKIRRLKEFMRNAIITIDPTGRFVYRTGDMKLDKELNPEFTPNEVEAELRRRGLR